jgi:hypothetical protein
MATPTQHSVDESVEGNSHQITRVNIDFGAPTIAIVISLMIIIGACGLVMGLNLAKQAEMDADFKTLKTQEWLVERRLMDDEAYRILNGQKMPADDANGPTGNLQRMVPRH